MIRRFGFSLVLLTAFIVAACGKQVTPNPPNLGAGGSNPGYMTVKFDVNGAFNFSNYQYWVVFNTSGNGLSPDTNPLRNNWAAYSDAIEVGGAGGGTFANAIQFIKNTTNPAIPPTFQNLHVGPPLLQYVANSNGTNTEYTVTFRREIFQNRATPTPGPTPTPTGSPLPYAKVWTFNAFTTQANAQNQLTFVDSMGVGGPNDTTWISPKLPICTNFDNVVYALSSGLQIDPAAQIVSVEIANNGTAPCPP